MAEPVEMIAEHLDDNQHGTAIKAPTKPQSHDQKAMAMKDRHGVDLEAPADHHGCDELAFDDIAQQHEGRRQQGIGDGVRS